MHLVFSKEKRTTEKKDKSPLIPLFRVYCATCDLTKKIKEIRYSFVHMWLQNKSDSIILLLLGKILMPFPKILQFPQRAISTYIG